MTDSFFPMAGPAEPGTAAAALATFVAGAQMMLDPATPEELRRQAEGRALAQLPVLRALGVFELFEVRDPALAALLHDELAELALRDADAGARQTDRSHRMRRRA